MGNSHFLPINSGVRDSLAWEISTPFSFNIAHICSRVGRRLCNDAKQRGMRGRRFQFVPVQLGDWASQWTVWPSTFSSVKWEGWPYISSLVGSWVDVIYEISLLTRRKTIFQGPQKSVRNLGYFNTYIKVLFSHQDKVILTVLKLNIKCLQQNVFRTFPLVYDVSILLDHQNWVMDGGFMVLIIRKNA